MIRYYTLLLVAFSLFLTFLLSVAACLFCGQRGPPKESKLVPVLTSSMVKKTTRQTSGITTGDDSQKKPETSLKISDDWELIDGILSLSNLPDLKLHDIVHNLKQQNAHVEAIEPVVRLDRLQFFLK